ncbi:MAG TPA: hypothetical protein VEK33_01135 [Terriglobales bacterium]|nr:hypothetical protein [Terriglobales bacterium]
MTRPKAMLGLQWTLGVVVFAEAGLLFSGRTHGASQLGVHRVVLTALALAEMLAAALFLLPRTVVIGGVALMVILALAMLIHILHGQTNVGALVVYAAAAWAVVAARRA